MTDDHLSDLNRRQRKAVLHGHKHPKMLHKPLLVIAAAGSGKTRVVAARVDEIRRSGVDPTRIVLLAFTNKAAREMVQRASEMAGMLPGGAQAQFPWAGTFHSVGVKLLRKFGRAIGISPSFTIVDRSDAEDLMGMIRHDLRLSEKKKLFPKKDLCFAIYSRRVNSASALKETLRKDFPSCRQWQRELKALFKAYEAAKRKQNVIDYDDMLALWLKLFDDPKTSIKLRALFDHVLIDEYQDTNPLQAKILLALKPDGRGVTVVGDDAQAIYSFRGATINNILDFPDYFRPRARIVTLERNYRSTQPILTACNGVIGLAKKGYSKKLYSERRSDQLPFMTRVKNGPAQARHVAKRILAAREAGIPLSEQAVLFRSSSHSGQLEIELERRGIPFVKWGGLRFLEASHIRDVLSILRWCENPKDRTAAFRALQLLPGIGPQSASLIYEQVQGAEFLSLLRYTTVPNSAIHQWRGFVRALRRTIREPWPTGLDIMCDWFGSQCQRLYPEDAERRLPDFEQLKDIVATFRSPKAFLTELTLEPPNVSLEDIVGEAPLILSTIHSAKGQEWRSVTILNVLEGCLPLRQATMSSDGVEEERRLLYVAMTRAKDQLDLIVPQVHHSHRTDGIKQVAQRSRFIPDALLRHFIYRHQ